MYRYQRYYTGPLQAIIMDLAGTSVDFGSLAPIRAFQQLFANEGVEITETEARGPMGTEKREHICQLLAYPRIGTAWQTAKGSAATDADIDRLYQAFVPLQIAAIAQNAELIPGLTDLLDYARTEQIKIGANTGYAETMIEELVEKMAEQGYTPDSLVCATQVPRGRPYPHMCLLNAIELEVENLAACVKIDDTLPGIDEGLNAGMWTIGLAASGNEVGLSLPAWQALPEDARYQLREKACERFARAGSHYIVDTIADVVPCLEDIQTRLALGERP